MSNREYVVTKQDWEIYPMPSETASFFIRKRFRKEALDCLKQGHLPAEMEDRWFSYYEDGKLYIHRSWSGFCIYVVTFGSFFNIHRVTVNRNEDQYSNTDIAEDKELLNHLLDNLAC